MAAGFVYWVFMVIYTNCTAQPYKTSAARTKAKEMIYNDRDVELYSGEGDAPDQTERSRYSTVPVPAPAQQRIEDLVTPF